MPMVSRLRVYAVSVAFVCLVLSPLFRDPPRDSFPLSDYPMFSLGRPSPLMTVTHALAVFPDGKRRPLSPLVATGNREVLQAMIFLRDAAADPVRRDEECRAIAARVARVPELREARAVELATSVYDAVAYFLRSRAPLERQVHAACEVPR